jgi:hypothetical protein
VPCKTAWLPTVTVTASLLLRPNPTTLDPNSEQVLRTAVRL